MDKKQQYAEIYRQETEEHLEAIEEVILDIEDNPDDKDGLDRLFRAIHTIKGSGSMFGFDDIAAFSHHVETVLDHVREGKIPVTRQLIDLILMVCDRIKVMLDASDDIDDADAEADAKIIAALQKLLPEPVDKITDTDIGVMLQLPNRIEDQDKETVYNISFGPHADIITNGMDPTLLLNELRDLGECRIVANTDAIPTLDELEAEKCHFSWDISLKTHVDINAVKDVFIFVEEDSLISIRDISDTPFESHEVRLIPRLEKNFASVDINESVSEKPDETPKTRYSQQKIGELLIASDTLPQEEPDSAWNEQKKFHKRKFATIADSIRVSSAKLDNLVNLVGELVITQARLTEIASTSDEAELAEPVEALESLTSELRDCTLDMRMMPIGTIFGKFRRLIRDLAVELGKEVELIIQGADTKLDKAIIERLSDPLLHLIRNSIDHGIHTPEEREKNGKPRKGTIRLSAVHLGTKVVITISDDGEGLDTGLIRDKAVAKGLITSDTELSPDETYSLIFAPGFSTAHQVTRVSGRGVGMDVVKREINTLGGEIRIISEKGEGTSIRLTMPLTLAIIDGLLVAAGDRRFVFPLEQVESCAELIPELMASAQGRNMIRIEDELLPFIRLRDIFEINGNSRAIEQIAVVQAEHYRAGIIVDEILGNVQTVIKPLDRIYQHVEGISGATIMGDGAVSLIIDVPGLIRCARREEEKGNEYRISNIE
ncbi:chemotaxis protein CheA [Desulfococcaceae bacterium HSG9]|nr:chemotaxis protein CheA [Desulfococcaceae bacterium HSG9]